MRVGFIFVVLGFMALPAILLGQDNKADTVTQLQEVSVYAQNLQKSLIGNKVIQPSQKTKAFHEGGSLIDVLQQQTNIHMKSYGSGMLSSIAFRGTTASQTSVIWNDFNINNYSLGQMDFSLLPVFAADELLLLPGGGSSYGGNGAIGGTVTLLSTLPYHQPQQLRINGLLGSFEKYQSSINYTGSIKQLAFESTFYYKEAANNFYISSIDRDQPNAAFQNYGFKQQLGYELADDQRLELSVWYHHNERNIQPALRNFKNHAFQEDDNLRSSLKYLQYGANYTLKIGTGFFNDQLAYVLDGQTSKYRTTRSENFIEVDLFPFDKHQFTIEARANLIQAFSDGFNPKIQNEQRYSWRLKASGVFFDELNYALHIGQQIVSQTRLRPFTPYLGLQYPFIKGKHHQLKIRANTSYNYRVPTLNDRFWELPNRQPILAEHALNMETGLSYTFNMQHYGWGVNATLFNNNITNYIQWRSEKGELMPENIGDVEIRGVEVESNFHNTLTEKLDFQLSASYALNNAKALGNGNEPDYYLIYVPLHKIGSSLTINYDGFGFSYYFIHTSQVFTTEKNFAIYALPAFSLHDIGINYSYAKLDVAFRAKNLLNKTYQTYLNYAMPGRNFELSINYTFNLKSQ